MSQLTTVIAQSSCYQFSCLSSKTSIIRMSDQTFAYSKTNTAPKHCATKNNYQTTPLKTKRGLANKMFVHISTQLNASFHSCLIITKVPFQ